MALDSIRIPVLVAHHRDDGCRVCLFADVPPILGRLTATPRKELMVFDGGISVGNPCEARRLPRLQRHRARGHRTHSGYGSRPEMPRRGVRYNRRSIFTITAMHLVIQGADIETRDLKELAKLSGASAIDRLSATAFRLRGAKPAEDIAALCSKARLDFGFVPEGRKLSDFRLLVMDMDSTLITMETIDELADMVNIKAEVARITERAMRGEIEYEPEPARTPGAAQGPGSIRAAAGL